MEAASRLLLQYTEGILAEYGIDLTRVVLTGAGDDGSDVKCSTEKLVTALREWCVGHHTTISPVDGVGTS
jgi:hypothetical protein